MTSRGSASLPVVTAGLFGAASYRAKLVITIPISVVCLFWVIRVDSRVPVDVRLASIFAQAPRHSQAVVNPLEGVRLRNLGSIGPAADHAGGESNGHKLIICYPSASLISGKFIFLKRR
jgi:hypothetical protein